MLSEAIHPNAYVNLSKYFIGIQLIPFIVIAPYISSSQWSAVFQVPALIRPVVPVWYVAAK
jgi:hypothetical protein